MKTNTKQLLKQDPSNLIIEPLLTEKETCEYLHVGRSTLNRRRLSGDIPWINLGQGAKCVIRFRKRDLDAYLERCTKDPLEVRHA